MIDVSSLRATSFAFKLITPSKVQRAHSNNLKNRRIILSRYQKVGNPQDFSQIPLSARDSFNVNGQKPRSESHDRKTHRPTTRESCESPSIISLRFNPPPSTKRSTVMSRTHSQPFIRPPILLSRSQSTIGTPMMTMRTHTQVTTRKESEISVLPEKKETEVFEEKNIKTTLGHLDDLPLQKSIVIKTSKAVMSEGNEKNEKNIAFSLLKDMKSVTSFVAIAKFLKKKAQRTIAKKNGKKEQQDEKTIAPTSPQVRVVKLINPEIVEENNNMVCNYANPIAAMFEDIPSEEFYKQLSGDVFTPKKLLEYIENSDLWDPLGEMIDIHTDQKLEYQATYTKFKKNRHFNLEDYGLLEWRSQAKGGTVRKIYHRQSLKVFALRSINLEKFNNDPTDVKNDLRICSLLIKHPHKAILRFISSKLAIVSDSSPRTKRSGSVDMLMDLKASLNMNVEVVGELGVVNLKELNKMRKKQGIKWTEDELIILLKELVSALAHCESLGIAHRNIKPSNIFFGEDKVTTKLTDFKLGLLTTSRQKRIETNVVGTPRYMSYELKRVYNNLKAKKIAASMIKYDPFLSDVSSLALVILELTMLSLSPEKAMIKLEVESAVIILKEIKEIYPNLSKTLQRMLSHEPNIRPRFTELEVALTLPNEAHRREVYDIRYNLVTHLDETRREDVISADDYMEMTKAYVRIVMSERQNKRAVNQKETPAWKRDKTMKKKEGAANGVQDKGIGPQSYRASVLKMLNISFEEYRNKGQYKKAVSALTMMGDVLFQIYHTDEKEGFVYVISSLARMNQLLNLCRESVEFYVQAYNISKKCYGETSLPSAILLNNIASLYYSTGETQRVKEVYQRALKIKETLGLTEQISYAIGLQNMANTNQITGDIKSAVNDYHEALRIYTTFFDDVIKETGELYLAISVLHYAVRGDKESGEQYILHALDIYREAPVEIRDGLLGTAYYRLGLFKYCFREFEAASDAYEKAIKFLEIAIVKQVGLLDAVKDSQRTLRNEAGFVVEMKKSKLL